VWQGSGGLIPSESTFIPLLTSRNTPFVYSYIRVWQGSGGSTPPDNQGAVAETAQFNMAQFKLYGGQSVKVKGASLL
jgi:hypothetical protein